MAKRELWEFKYSPKNFDEIIMNSQLKGQLGKNLDDRPNMLLHGPPGVGKGCYIDELIRYNEIEDNYIKINCSMEGNIDNIREKVMSFASSMSFNNKLKLVYLNEIDHPNLIVSMQSLRQLIEDTEKTTQFVLVCNYVQNVIPELISRCQIFNVANPPAKEILQKCMEILDNEGVQYKKKSVLELVKSVYPDIRSTIVTLQQNVVDNKLKESISLFPAEGVFGEVFEAMKTKDPEKVRKVIRSNAISYKGLYEYLYKQLMETEEDIFKNDATALLLIGEHSYRNEIVSIQEINFMHMYFRFLKEGVL